MSLWGLNWRVETSAVGAVGVGNLLEVVDDPEVWVDWAGFGTVPEVEAEGEEGTVLSGDEEDDDDWAGLADVLAFGVFTLGIGISAGVISVTGIDLAARVILGWIGGAWSGIKLAMASPPVTVYQLNLNSGTVSSSPVRSR